MASETLWPQELNSAAELLSKAVAYADAMQCSPWDFAVEINEFKEAGVSLADLRYLILQGLLEHAKELTAEATGNRRFRPTGRLTFARHTCFILSQQGRQSLSHLNGNTSLHHLNGQRATTGTATPLHGISNTAKLFSGTKPDWNSNLRRLTFGELVVKQYRAPALNQHTILSAFQEENWGNRIDDPLPQVDHIEQKRRLHEAIAGLNRNQLNAILHFSGDGSGRGVRWSAAIENPITKICNRA
jgi:hypothetical protein